MHPIALVAALGNPGTPYSGTRHNAGWWCLDRLRSRYGLEFRRESRFQGEVGRARIAGRPVWFIAPHTFMNRSGDAVAAIARFYKIPPEAVLVLHDEVDLPPGTVRLKRGGGLAGNKGLTDIAAKLGSREFARLRIGVGHPGDSRAVVSYVLSPPSAEDKKNIEAAIGRACDRFDAILAGEHEQVMNDLHRGPPAGGAAGTDG